MKRREKKGVLKRCLKGICISAFIVALTLCFDSGRCLWAGGGSGSSMGKSCSNNTQCPKWGYCEKDTGECTGQGTCQPRPEACTQVWQPVCGCDGKTYGNECEAAAEGVNVAYEGACSPGVTGCIDNSGCGSDSYCQKNTGNCTAQGACAPRPEACPEVWEPVCGCDGKTYGNACEAAAHGINIDHEGSCSQGGAGCSSNMQCGPGSYCQRDVGECTGQGVCTSRPEACPQVWEPVCGCDGKTYSNACEAAAVGINVDHNGECTPGAIGCTYNTECGEPLFCQKDTGDCSGLGTCASQPGACPDVWEPVCGCDGKIYGNACEAATMGINIEYTGQCSSGVAGCTDNSECLAASYCDKDTGDCEGQGTCTSRPEACPQVWEPVCGCDGKTYGNACEAAAMGINIEYTGQCSPGVAACTNTTECPAGSYCEKDTGDCAGQGTCAPKPDACPEVWEPVCGCDGKTYGSSCEAAAQGIAVDYTGECSPGAVECTDYTQCPAGSYCKKASGACTSKGTCAPIPQSCPQVLQPVCGCDGKTYGNSCEAALQRMNVYYSGECGVGVSEVSSCAANSECASYEYCKKDTGKCSGQGTCETRPEVCTEVLQPVCGCDGKTYGNSCEAAASGINIQYTGECKPQQPQPVVSPWSPFVTPGYPFNVQFPAFGGYSLPGIFTGYGQQTSSGSSTGFGQFSGFGAFLGASQFPSLGGFSLFGQSPLYTQVPTYSQFPTYGQFPSYGGSSVFGGTTGFGQYPAYQIPSLGGQGLGSWSTIAGTGFQSPYGGLFGFSSLYSNLGKSLSSFGLAFTFKAGGLYP